MKSYSSIFKAFVPEGWRNHNEPTHGKRPLARSASIDPKQTWSDMLLAMDFDDQLRRFFGTEDLDTLTPDALAGGVVHMRVAFGLEKDQGRQFAMWSILYMLGDEPDLDMAFKDATDRDAARNFMDLMDKSTNG